MADEQSLSLYETIEQVLVQGHGQMPADEFATRALGFIHG
jgi:hypothetical protein